MKTIKLRIANYLLKNLFKVVLESEIIHVDKKTGAWYLRGTKLSEEQINSLIQQAKTLQGLELFHLLLAEMKFISNKRMFDEALSTEDLLGGKWMLYTIDVLSKKVYNISTQK